MFDGQFDLKAFAYGYIACLVVTVLIIWLATWLSKLVDRHYTKKMPRVSASTIHRYFGEGKDAEDSPVVKESPRQRSS
jgi:hypothetical protein